MLIDAAEYERAIAKAYHRGYNAANRGRVKRRQRAKHKAAIEANELWHCRKCGEDKPAQDFYATHQTQCKRCKDAAKRTPEVRAEQAARFRRNYEERKKRHAAAVIAGEIWHCPYCEQDKPVTEYYSHRQDRCRECVKAESRAKYERSKNAAQ